MLVELDSLETVGCGCRSAEGAPDAAPGAGGLQPGEDGAIVGGPRTPQQIAAQKRLQQTQAQVDEVCQVLGEEPQLVGSAHVCMWEEFQLVGSARVCIWEELQLVGSAHMCMCAAGGGHHEDQCGESAGARPEAVGAG